MPNTPVLGKGWLPDTPDHRDRLFSPPPGLLDLPASVDLRTRLAPWAALVYNQGALGSCTANAICAAFSYAVGLVGPGDPRTTVLQPSRLFLYYQERLMENTVNSDSGAMIRDGMKAASKVGLPLETDWPYDISQFTAKPSDTSYTDAGEWKINAYEAVRQDINHMKACLASGRPFVFGFTVYESFESDEVSSTGVVNLPGRSEKDLGGHAVLAVGYDEASRRFLVRNSWDKTWGQGGYFTMPYDYVSNDDLADDLWCIDSVITPDLSKVQ